MAGLLYIMHLTKPGKGQIWDNVIITVKQLFLKVIVKDIFLIRRSRDHLHRCSSFQVFIYSSNRVPYSTRFSVCV